jgi:opacity protein-like surface antigen
VAALFVVAAPVASAGDFAIDAQGGYFSIAAKDSAEAVLGSSGFGTFGGGLGYTFGNGIFVHAGARFASKDGERVFVADPAGEVFELGHPLSFRLVPVELTLGYRFAGFGAFTPYVGAGGGFTSVKEESTVAGITEAQSQSKASGHVRVGLEYGRGALRFAVEGQWSTVPDAIGVGGVSKVYGETNVGGFTVLGKIIFTTARD